MPLFSDVNVDTTSNGASNTADTKSKYLEDLLLVKKDKLNNDQNSNKRMIAFNESYRKKQGDYLWLLLYVFIALIIFCFFYIMKTFFPFIPDIVMDLLYVNLFAFLLLFISIKIYYIQKRSNMNYDELDIPSNIPKPNDPSNNVPGKDVNLYGELTLDTLATQVVNSIFDFNGGIYTCSYKNNRYFITYTYTDERSITNQGATPVAKIKKKRDLYI